jgi:hypothetical protein
MPIRFRCAFCNQLLGIARRKSGSVINCPTCGGPLVVPREAEEQGKNDAGPSEQRLLEECDVDVLLKPPVTAQVAGSSAEGQKSAVTAPSSIHGSGVTSAGELHTSNGEMAAPPLPAAKQPGFFITPGRATLAAVAIVLLLAVAFVAGFLIGRM